MGDSLPTGRALFWGAAAALLALAAVPSVVLVDNVERYVRFLSAWDPGSLAMLQTHRLPHREGPDARETDPQVYFVDFHLEAPKAKSVLLAGDFNRWQPKGLPLRRQGRGPWEVLVALPSGKYQYLFQVDGAWARDPAAKDSGRKGPLTTSVRSVP